MNRWGQTGTNRGHVHTVPTGDGQGHPPKGVSPVPADRVTLDHPHIQRAKRAISLRILQGKEKTFDVLSAKDGESHFGPRKDGHSWHLHQTQRPLFRKHEHWRHNLLCVFDQWAGRIYRPGENECFIFSMACLDAMLGTSLHQRNIGQWETIKGFYEHVRVVGSLDFFDLVGIRAPLSEAMPGDLAQEEVEMNGKLYLHWGIISDKPRTQISFAVSGLSESTINRAFNPHSTMRLWRLLDPVARDDVGEVVPIAPPTSEGLTGRSTVPFSLPKKSGGKFDG